MPVTIDGTTGVSAVQSGAVDLTTDVTGSLPVANGGVGAATLTANAVLLGNGTSALQTVAPSTSGNVLTSNGTTWTSSAPPAGGVTSLNGQSGAITNTDLYAIGSYVTGRPQNGTAYAVNSTIAGSSLYTTSNGAVFYEPSANQWRDYSNATLTAATFATLINTGTWRCVSPAGTKTQFAASGLWVRIS